MTPHPCHGPGWTRLPGPAVERYVRGLSYQERRAEIALASMLGWAP